MNKKNTLFILTFTFMATFSYSQTTEKSVEVAPPLVGGDGDTDKHGCKPSAGYTFSSIKNDCVRLFEQKIQLKEVESKQSYSTFVAVIFSDDKRKAEIFVPNTESSLVLLRKGRRLKWQANGFELLKVKDYVLKKVKKVIYRGN